MSFKLSDLPLAEQKKFLAKNPSFKEPRPRKHHAGFRADIGLYVRSSWEANMCRLLNFMVAEKMIDRWEYEPKTFWFVPGLVDPRRGRGVIRGCVSYKPDFHVWERGAGAPVWWELKGFMDSKSKTKLQRMKKYYPAETVILIDAAEYRRLIGIGKAVCESWE